MCLVVAVLRGLDRAVWRQTKGMIAGTSGGICEDAAYHTAYPNVEIEIDIDGAEHRAIDQN